MGVRSSILDFEGHDELSLHNLLFFFRPETARHLLRLAAGMGVAIGSGQRDGIDVNILEPYATTCVPGSWRR